MNDWKIVDGDELLLENLSLDMAFSMLNKYGQNVTIRIEYETNTIRFLNADSNIPLSELISNGRKRKQISEYKKFDGFINKFGYKFCTKCKQSKPLEEFGYRKENNDGRSRICKKCVNKRAKKYYRRKKKG